MMRVSMSAAVGGSRVRGQATRSGERPTASAPRCQHPDAMRVTAWEVSVLGDSQVLASGDVLAGQRVHGHDLLDDEARVGGRVGLDGDRP